MRILVTNDDGIQAEGIKALAEVFEPDHEVWVVAPDREQSASSHKLTLSRPLRIKYLSERWVSVDGTPTDSVYVGLHQVLPKPPDIILSGINRGPNLGDDVTYSGTVAAAMEGAVLNIPSIAFSIVGFANLNYTEAAKVARRIAVKVAKQGLPARRLLNVNIPPQIDAEKAQIRLTRLGRRDYRQFVVKRLDPRGKEYYWIGGDAMGVEPVPGSDMEVIENGMVSVTPLSLNLTAHSMLESMNDWEW